MLYSEINHTKLKASKLVLGTDTFGTQISEQDAFMILDRYVNAGGNIVDTAGHNGTTDNDSLLAKL